MTRRPKADRLLNRSLMHTAARLHYLDGLSQLEVSRRMEVSTATVSRLLALARDEGIVRIQVADLHPADVLGEKLAAALALKAVRVIDGGRAAALNAEVGALLLGAGLAPGAVLAVGWGRTVQSVIAAGLPRLPGLVVVPTTGGMHQTASHFQINEFVRRAAAQMGAQAQFLHAPSIVSAELRAVLARDPDTARILDAWGRAEAAIVGIGQHQRDTGASPDLAEADAAVGDVVRHYVDVGGRNIIWPGQADLMSISRAQLQRIPLCIGLAIGREKAAAIIGAARSGMVNALVTDTRAATAMLELLERGV